MIVNNDIIMEKLWRDEWRNKEIELKRSSYVLSEDKALWTVHHRYARLGVN